MAGVVNVILRKKYVGTAISAEAGTTTEGGGFTDHATVMHGMGDLDADGYNAYINLEYRRQNNITCNQRQGDGLWSSLNQSVLRNSAQHKKLQRHRQFEKEDRRQLVAGCKSILVQKRRRTG
jgi:hypothetical protein